MKFCLMLLALLCVSLPVQAQEMNYRDFSALPILHEGRVKPLDSFARHTLKTFSGRERFEGRSAIDWLARTLFDPGQAAEEKIFTIRNPQALGLFEHQRAINYIQLAAALEEKEDVLKSLMASDPKHWTADQKTLVEYNNNALIYGELLRSLTMMLPLNIAPPASLGIKGDNLTYSDLSRHADTIDARVKDIIKKKGSDPTQYNEEEGDIVAFAYQLNLLGRASELNALFKVLPAGTDYVSPWMAARDNPARKAWQAMAMAWHAGDETQWARTTHDLAIASVTPRLRAELIYNQFHPLGLAMILYLFGFLAASLHAIFGKIFLRRAARSAVIAAITANAIAIGLRISILERLPVGTLYESIIFVALIAALGGLLFALKGRDVRGLMAAALSGGLLLFIAEGFATDDTMQMLVAVLNTNFWLATHVLCITIGYGWCILTALFAHFYLLSRALGHLTAVQHVRLTQTTKSLALIALLFTTIGTILGGIWADQSWGRFWGWDPKENGALLIVLWLSWCLHGSIAGQLKSLPFMASLAALNIIVALAWFGVNLLNTGLHSYGFIEGVALALFAFVAIELAAIAGLWIITLYRDKKNA